MKSSAELLARQEAVRNELRKATNDISLATEALLVADTAESRMKSQARIDDSQRREMHAERELVVLEEEIKRAAAREAVTIDDAAWRRCDEAGAALQTEVAKLQRLADKFGEQLTPCFNAGIAFRNSLPIPPAPSEDATLAWSPVVLSRLIKIHLAIATDGKFESGVLWQGVWAAKQQPDMNARVGENVARVLSWNPNRKPEAA